MTFWFVLHFERFSSMFADEMMQTHNSPDARRASADTNPVRCPPVRNGKKFKRCHGSTAGSVVR